MIVVRYSLLSPTLDSPPTSSSNNSLLLKRFQSETSPRVRRDKGFWSQKRYYLTKASLSVGNFSAELFSDNKNTDIWVSVAKTSIFSGHNFFQVGVSPKDSFNAAVSAS